MLGVRDERDERLNTMNPNRESRFPNPDPPSLTPEQFRRMLEETLAADPTLARRVPGPFPARTGAGLWPDRMLASVPSLQLRGDSRVRRCMDYHGLSKLKWIICWLAMLALAHPAIAQSPPPLGLQSIPTGQPWTARRCSYCL